MTQSEDFTQAVYVTRVHNDPATLDRQAWNQLLDAQPQPTPFLCHEYLSALHDSGSAVPTTGWAPQFITLHRNGELHAACATYLKSHSYGEYVFDWAWADAYRRHGLRYYPKLLSAIPFTPVPGTRWSRKCANWIPFLANPAAISTTPSSMKVWKRSLAQG